MIFSYHFLPISMLEEPNLIAFSSKYISYMTSDSVRSTMILICFITHFSYDKIPN